MATSWFGDETPSKFKWELRKNVVVTDRCSVVDLSRSNGSFQYIRETTLEFNDEESAAEYYYKNRDK